MDRHTRTYVALVVIVAAVLLAVLLPHASISDPLRFGGFLLVALLASVFKVRIPGLTGTYSLGFVVLLAAVSELSLAEVLGIALACAVAQSYWRAARRPQLVQVVFNAANLVISVAGASAVFHASRFWSEDWLFLSVGLAALGYYVLNTGLTAAVLCLVEGGTLRRMWAHWNFYTLPYCLLGCTLAMAWVFCSRQIHWQGALIAAFLLYQVFRLMRGFVSFQQSVEGHRT